MVITVMGGLKHEICREEGHPIGSHGLMINQALAANLNDLAAAMFRVAQNLTVGEGKERFVDLSQKEMIIFC